ncbi:MAG: hypothetical protein JWP44_3910 [Mucilaginibacter sp.]|nr:hypothetical protein [Mucilaginibacter sp.]
MKKILLSAVILTSSLFIQIAKAQVHVSVGFNIGSQPDWGPVGYTRAEYYYMPDIDAYYDVPNHQYIYYDNYSWVRVRALPPRYHFDRYRTYKVVVNQRNPWERDDQMRQRYAGYRGRYDQPVIRDSRDERYRNHWHEDNGNHNGQRNDQGRGNGDQGRGDQGRGHGDQGHGDQGRGHGDQGHGDHGGHGDH